MKVCGFTIIRNAIQYDFPIKEAILSIDPLCDVIYVGVGNSGDGTRALIESISSKIIIIDTIWDDDMREGGKVLAMETNKVMKQIPDSFDWCVYIQGDEAIHEKYHEEIKMQMQKNLTDQKIDGFLFHYLHFYGSYDYVAKSSKWYRHEIRIIRNNNSFYSYKDAQGFRKNENEKLSVKLIDAFVYHYGYVKNPKVMKEKMNNSNRMWHNDKALSQILIETSEFDYNKIDHLERFEGSHPKVFKERIEATNWEFNFDIKRTNRTLKEKIKFWIEKNTGWKIGEYKNYRKI